MPCAECCVSSEPETGQRLFFALWPDDPVRDQLHRAGREHLRKQGRVVARERLHITLVFLGTVDARMRDCTMGVAERVQAESFELALSRIGVWTRSRVQWLAPRQVPDALQSLVQQLNDGLRGCGFEPERRPFMPHVTLARKVSRPMRPVDLAPVCWPVIDFALVESRTLPEGPEYRVLQRWPLG